MGSTASKLSRVGTHQQAWALRIMRLWQRLSCKMPRTAVLSLSELYCMAWRLSAQRICFAALQRILLDGLFVFWECIWTHTSLSVVATQTNTFHDLTVLVLSECTTNSTADHLVWLGCRLFALHVVLFWSFWAKC